MDTRNDAPTETQLWVDNNEPLYRMKLAIWKGLMKKCRTGSFDADLARRNFRPLTDRAAVSYQREIREPLAVTDRREAETDFVNQFMVESGCGAGRAFTVEMEEKVKRDHGIRGLAGRRRR